MQENGKIKMKFADENRNAVSFKIKAIKDTLSSKTVVYQLCKMLKKDGYEFKNVFKAFSTFLNSSAFDKDAVKKNDFIKEQFKETNNK
jgi:hypothetical protein